MAGLIHYRANQDPPAALVEPDSPTVARPVLSRDKRRHRSFPTNKQLWHDTFERAREAPSSAMGDNTVDGGTFVGERLLPLSSSTTVICLRASWCRLEHVVLSRHTPLPKPELAFWGVFVACDYRQLSLGLGGPVILQQSAATRIS